MDRDSIKKRLVFWYSLFWMLFFSALYLVYRVYFIDTTSTKSKWVGLFVGVILILFASFKMLENSYWGVVVEAKKVFNSISKAINKYFSKIDRVIVFVAIIFVASTYKFFDIKFEIFFITGALIAKLLSISNLKLLFRASLEETFDFRNDISFRKMFSNSISVAFISFGVIISSVVIAYHICKDYQILLGLALGWALVYVFYVTSAITNSKAVSIVNEMFHKEYVNLSEEKGDYLCFVKTIFQNIIPVFYQINEMIFSFLVVFIASICVGTMCGFELMSAFFPIIVATNTLFSVLLSFCLIRLTPETDYIKLFIGINICSLVIYSLLTYYTVTTWFYDSELLILPCVFGGILGFVINCFALRQMFYSDKIANNISNASITGLKHVFLQTAKDSFKSVILPVFIAVLALLGSFLLSYGMEAPLFGLFGVMLCVLSICTFACISSVFSIFAQNLTNIETFSNIYPVECDFSLIKETGLRFMGAFKKYCSFLSLNSTIGVIIAYCVVSELEEVDIFNPFVLSALLIGVLVPFFFTSSNISFMLKIAKKMILNIKKQLRVYFDINLTEFDIANSNILKDIAIDSSLFTLFSYVVALFLFFVVTYTLLQEALASFLFSMLLVSSCIWFVFLSFSVFLNLASSYFKKQYDNANETEEFQILNTVKDIFSTLEDFIGPNLSILVKFIALLALCLIPVM